MELYLYLVSTGLDMHLFHHNGHYMGWSKKQNKNTPVFKFSQINEFESMNNKFMKSPASLSAFHVFNF